MLERQKRAYFFLGAMEGGLGARLDFRRGVVRQLLHILEDVASQFPHAVVVNW